MLEWLSAADPGRVHAEGRRARAALEDARAAVASLFGTRPRQVIFTSGATEAINAACFGALRRPSPVPPVVALAAVEHSAVREASRLWAAEVAELAVSSCGEVSVEDLADHLDRRPIALVHCQLANHEVGTVQPVERVADLCRRHGALLHVDAAAGAGHVPIDFDALGADLMSISAPKLGGPRGVGALLVRRGLRVDPLIVGGAQERARRGGLENVPGAIGFGAAAAELSGGGLEKEAAAARARTDRLRDGLAALEGVTFYGPTEPDARLAHLVCLGVAGIEAEPVLIGLDQAGVSAHSGSSCSSETLEPSPVLAAMGVEADHSLRLSVGWSTTDADLDRVLATLPPVLERLRRLRA